MSAAREVCLDCGAERIIEGELHSGSRVMLGERPSQATDQTRDDRRDSTASL
jgi:hypothetical protein